MSDALKTSMVVVAVELEIDGVLGAMAGAMGFSMPGAPGGPYWTSHCQGPAAVCAGLARCQDP